MCTQCFRLELSGLVVLLKAIQLMKIILRTSFRVSKNYHSDDKDRLFQGALQDSSVALAL